jgi:hypothetical protein
MKGFVVYKNACLVPYITPDGINTNLGNLTQIELGTLYNKLLTKKKFNNLKEGHKIQLSHIETILEYRRDLNMNKRLDGRLMPKAKKTADLITKWIFNSYK